MVKLREDSVTVMNVVLNAVEPGKLIEFEPTSFPHGLWASRLANPIR